MKDRPIISTALIASVIIMGFLIPTLAFISLENPSTTVSNAYSKRVLAFYYEWWGNTTFSGQWYHWNENDHNPPYDLAANQTPVLGPYDSSDNATIQQHLDWAQYAGIDTFIASWWGIGTREDANFANSLQYTTDHNINFTWSIYFESVQQQFQNNASEVARQIEYVCKTYGNQSHFLRQDGRPVIFCYAVGYEGLTNWTSAIQQIHAAGYNPFLIGDMGGLGMPNPGWLKIFDGIHIYNPAGAIHNNQDYNSGFQQLIFASQSAGRLACYTVNPGYDDFDVCCVALGKELLISTLIGKMGLFINRCGKTPLLPMRTGF